MPETSSQIRKDLARQASTAMVSAFLAVSPRLDTFSTWLMGVTTGFLLLLFTNMERTISVIKIGPMKALIVILLVSTLVGLAQKCLALRLHIVVDMDEAADRKMTEVVRGHSGQTIANPVQYFQENTDPPYVLTLFFSAFPKWMHKFLQGAIQSRRVPDLSHRQGETKTLVWQFVALGSQVLCALATIGVILLRL